MTEQVINMRVAVTDAISEDQAAVLAGHLVNEHGLPQGCGSEGEVANRLRTFQSLAWSEFDTSDSEFWEALLIDDGIRFSRTHYFFPDEDGQRFTYDPDRRCFAIDDVPNPEAVST